jgi:hypothetical protein
MKTTEKQVIILNRVQEAKQNMVEPGEIHSTEENVKFKFKNY